MTEVALNEGNILSSQIRVIEDHIIEVEFGRVHFFRPIESGMGFVGSINFNKFLLDEKIVKDAYLKNVCAELKIKKDKFAAL